MGTQVFINNNICKPEFTKIVAHALAFKGITVDSYANKLYVGGRVTGLSVNTWSTSEYTTDSAGLPPELDVVNKALGIPLPINLVSDDVVTISGNVISPYSRNYREAGYEIYLSVGVYYFNCTDQKDPKVKAYTFIPFENFLLNEFGETCFETSVTLGSNYDIHDTRFIVGFNISAICPTGDCIDPISPVETAVTYTLDIERPCAATIDNFIIRNCCEPVITELVNIPGLQVGNFHVDDEGNCWEVIEASKDVTNFTRNFVDIYNSCIECQGKHPCPQNLQIVSCCVTGKEFVTGSLPGLEVGDTFVDNNGLCWSVEAETGAPLSEESITVDTEIMGDCEVCKGDHPCPSFWYVESCCAQLNEIIAASVTLNLGDSFVDTNGICWYVVEEAFALPTNYGIVVDTVYSVDPETNCELCTNDNPCPTEYFITVRACCDNTRIEVISVPAEYMNFSEGTILSDQYNICWEVMSYSTTGVETYPLTWGISNPSVYRDCLTCTSAKGEVVCRLLYQVRDCNTNEIYTGSVINNILTVGLYYQGFNGNTGIKSCFEVLGFGYPQNDPLFIIIEGGTEFATCEVCNV